MRKEERFFQVFQRRIVELKLPLEGAIGQAPPALEHGDRLVEDLLKGHRPPSRRRGGVQQTVWEWEKSVGLVIPQMGDKRKPQSWKRVTAHCCEGRLGPRSAPRCRPGTMTRYRREKTVRGLPGAPTHNRPCSRPVYGTPKRSPGRAAESGFFWVGSEDSNEW